MKQPARAPFLQRRRFLCRPAALQAYMILGQDHAFTVVATQSDRSLVKVDLLDSMGFAMRLEADDKHTLEQKVEAVLYRRSVGCRLETGIVVCDELSFHRWAEFEIWPVKLTKGRAFHFPAACFCNYYSIASLQIISTLLCSAHIADIY